MTFRPTRRGKSDTDAVLLKRYIAQARQTIMMGSADTPELTDEDEVGLETGDWRLETGLGTLQGVMTFDCSGCRR